MRLVIIANDALIGIDGSNYSNVDISQLNSDVHAVQWYDTYGEVEFKTKFENNQIVKPQNQIINDLTPYQWAVDVWNSAKAAEEAAIAAAEAEAAAQATEQAS